VISREAHSIDIHRSIRFRLVLPLNGQMQMSYQLSTRSAGPATALEAAVRLSDRYITGRFLPDKAIDIMDEAGSRARINSMTRPPGVKEIEKISR
jgi:ATP-dependent Clp protease ATP-binding subunit ClpC